MKKKILIVEDDPFLGMIVKECFDTRGFEAKLIQDGLKGYEAFCQWLPDLCVLDVMMPKKDGFALAEDIRTVDKKVPIIFLTAKAMTEDVVKGFTIGANDYVKKPFSMEELIARVQGILARQSAFAGEMKAAKPLSKYQIGKFLFNYDRYQLTIEGKMQKLTPKEAELLRMLYENKNQLLDRRLTLKKIWGDDTLFNARSMDVFIVKLRKYLKKDPQIELINIRGEGYKLLILEEDTI